MRAFPVLPPVGRRATASALDIRASVGTSTSPTATGTRAVTGVGFQPKVVLPFCVGLTSDGVSTQTLLGVGASTASAQSAVSVASLTAQTTSLTRRRHSSVAHEIIDPGTGNAQQSAAFSSFDFNGFTLNWSSVLFASVLNHICLGGADLEVSLTQHQMNGTNAAQSFAHGLSGAPTGVLFFSAIYDIPPPGTSAALFMSIGAWAGSSQWGASIFSANGTTTTSTRRRLATDSVAAYHATTVVRTMAVSSVDAASVNVTYPVTNSYQPYVWMLAIRGAKCQVGTFDCNGSTSPLTINTTGITPKLFLPVFVPEAVDSIGSVLTNLLLTIGASDGTNNVSCGITDTNGVTTTDARRYQSSNSLIEYNQSGTLRFQGTAAFSGESIVLTPSTNINASFGQGGYLVIGS